MTLLRGVRSRGRALVGASVAILLLLGGAAPAGADGPGGGGPGGRRGAPGASAAEADGGSPDGASRGGQGGPASREATRTAGPAPGRHPTRAASPSTEASPDPAPRLDRRGRAEHPHRSGRPDDERTPGRGREAGRPGAASPAAPGPGRPVDASAPSGPEPISGALESRDRVRVLAAGRVHLVSRTRMPAAPSPAPEAVPPTPSVAPAPAAAGTPDPHPDLLRQVVDALAAVPGWFGTPSLDEPGFPALVLVLLGLFVVITGRGDRRDPKLIRADLDARDREVGFS